MELIDLTKILKVGDEVYYIISGQSTIVTEIKAATYPIVCKAVTVTKDGRLYNNYDNGECVIFPSKTERDWSKYIQQKESQKLLKEAKLRYPIGTKIKSAVVPSIIGIINGNPFLYVDGDISIEVIDNKNRSFKVTLYYADNKKWAEIVKEPLFITEDGIELCDGDSVWYCRKDYYTSPIISLLAKDANPSKSENLLYFSTEQAAKDWKFKTFKDKSPFTQDQREEIIRLINMYK